MTSRTSDPSSTMMLALALIAIFAVVAYVVLSSPLDFRNASKSDYQRGWDAAAAAYRGDYARGVADGQHRALVAHCIGPMEAPSE